MSATTFCLLCGTGWFWAVEPPQDPLWRKAVAVCSTNGDWLAGLVVMRSEVLYKGQSAGVHELWERCSLGANGEVLTETIKVLEDGKDTTPKEKSKSKAKQDTKKSANPGGGNPFDPKVQNQVTAKPTGRSKVLDGKNCVAYEFELKASNALVVRGTAWLETDTGRPIETENMSLNPLPEKRLKSIAITVRYESTADGAWYVKEMIMTGTVSMLLIKADIRSTTTFSQYWRKR